jgi:hypothetical protein
LAGQRGVIVPNSVEDLMPFIDKEYNFDGGVHDGEKQ